MSRSMTNARSRTVGTWLRAFMFGHVRQLDQVTGELLGRAWAAGAGPGDSPLTVDVDRTICEVHGYHKQGACYGYTRRLGLHPLLAFRADTGEVVHARLRKGSANTARGVTWFTDELVARLRRAGATGELTIRRDSGFWSAKLIRRLRAHQIRYSITVRQTKAVRAAVAASPRLPWSTSRTRRTGSPKSPRPPTAATGWSSDGSATSTTSSGSFPPGATTRSLPTGPAPRSHSTPTAAAMPSASWRSATSKQALGW
jgi:Transposase DDE domain group 1